MNLTEDCQKCNAEEDDLRTLWMACFYEMNELGLPFEKEQIREGGIRDDHPNETHNFYTLRVCKECRARWMDMIKTWFHFPFKRESPGTGIFVRHFGTNLEVTEEEWRENNPGIEPVRVIQDE